MLENYRAALKWNRAQTKVNNAVGVLSKFGFGYSPSDGVVGNMSELSKRDQRKINAAADTMKRYKAGYFTEKQRFSPENPLSIVRYAPMNLADYEAVQRDSFTQFNESMHLRAPIKFLQRVNYDPRLQAHPNRRVLGIDAETAQSWSANVESMWRDDKESKTWDYTYQNNYPQIADMAFASYLSIGEFFCIRRLHVNDDDRITNISLQLISPFQVSSPFFTTGYNVLSYSKTENCIVAIPAGEFLSTLEDGNYIDSGIEYDKQGIEIAIYLSPGNWGGSWQRIPCRTESGFQQVLHGFIQTEPGQKRGIPDHATSWHEYCNIRDLTIFELQSAKLNSTVAGTVTADSNAQPNGRNSMNELGRPAPNWDNIESPLQTLPPYEDPNYSVRKVEGGGFIVQNFTPGYKYTELDTKRPNLNIPDYIDKLLEVIYPANHGLSIHVVKQVLGGSYNASKGELDLSWKNGVEYQLKQFSSDFHIPNYQAWLNGKVAAGEASAPGWEKPRLRAAWSSMTIIVPVKPSLNPYQEARASSLKITEGISNREYESQQTTGTSAEENAERLRPENEKLAYAREPIFNQENPQTGGENA